MSSDVEGGILKKLWQIIRGTNGGPTPAPIVKPQKNAVQPGVKNEVRRIEQIMARVSPKNRKLLVGVARRMHGSRTANSEPVRLRLCLSYCSQSRALVPRLDKINARH